MPPFLPRPPLCLARNCLTVRQFGPLESIDPNDAMILPYGAKSRPDEIFGKDRLGQTRRARSGAKNHSAVELTTSQLLSQRLAPASMESLGSKEPTFVRH